MNAPLEHGAELLAKRITLTGRERYVLRMVLDHMIQNSSCFDPEGKCLLGLARAELQTLIERLQ
jgi:hypothetical protein